jgi:hypothetical protein
MQPKSFAMKHKRTIIQNISAFGGAGFSLWVLVLAGMKPHELKPAAWKAQRRMTA